MDLGLNHRFTPVDSVLLFGGSAAMALLIAYSALDAPAGRNETFAAISVFMFSFVPQLLVHEWMGEWVWGVRYLGVGAIAAALLVRLRRTRPGSYGFFLRGAAIVGTWWGLLRTVALVFTHTQFDGRSELYSRVVYLLLAAGMLDMRRFVGAVPMKEPARTFMHTAREVATTRVCLALLSLGAALSASTYTWHSEWNVIASAELVAVGVTIAFHVPWMLRTLRMPPVSFVGALMVVGVGLAKKAYDEQPFAPWALVVLAAAAVATDVIVERFARKSKDDPDAKSTRVLAVLAIVLHVAAAAITIARVA